MTPALSSRDAAAPEEFVRHARTRLGAKALSINLFGSKRAATPLPIPIWTC